MDTQAQDGNPPTPIPNNTSEAPPAHQSLNDQMLSKKHMIKVKDEVLRMKELVSTMKITQDEHHQKILNEIVDDQKLSITLELLENAFEERMK